MKYYYIPFLTVCLFSVFAIPSQEAMAKERVYCVFKWEANPTKNIRSSEDWAENYASKEKLILFRDVRNREHDRLVNAGVVNVRMSAKRGNKCTLNHPENTLIDIKLRKSGLRIDQTKELPECHDIINATVECRSTLPPDRWR